MSRGKAPLASVAVAVALFAQACVLYHPVAAYPPPLYSPQIAGAPPAHPAGETAAPVGSPLSGIDQLLEPIALYPDPLIALILPASTVPSDISAAAAYLVQYGDVTRIDSQPWDPSVRSLAHYPTVITWMADNPAWTRALGSAFLSSPAEVMDSVQRLRARAMAAGALASTDQQQVLADDGDFEILPAQPDSIYVPAYDTDVVYSEEPYYGYGGPFINFGAPFPVGPWLSFCFDWHSHGVWVGGWSAWHGPGGWHRPRFGGGRPAPGFRPWHPTARAQSFQPPGFGPRENSVPRPRPMPGAPNPPPARFKGPANQANPPARTPGSVQYGPRTPAPPVERPGPVAQATPSLSGAAAGQPVSRPYEYYSRPVAAEPSYATSEGGPRVHESAPAPARSQTEAPAAHAAPTHESAPAPAHASAPAPASDVKSR